MMSNPYPCDPKQLGMAVHAIGATRARVGGEMQAVLFHLGDDPTISPEAFAYAVLEENLLAAAAAIGSAVEIIGADEATLADLVGVRIRQLLIAFNRDTGANDNREPA